MSAAESNAPSRFRADRMLYLALVVATLVYCPLLFTGLNRYGRGDWDQFTVRYETPRVSLLRDHQLPFWNPYVNGGTVLWAHPHFPAASPWYALVLALGAPVGLRVQAVLFMALGTTGMAALLRHWNVPRIGCFIGGVILMMSSHFALHLAEGHLEWCALGLMPWLVLCVLRIPNDFRYVAIAGLLLASVVMFGSVYIVAVYVPFLTLWLLLETVRTRKPSLVLGWCGVLAIAGLLSAVKLLPQLEFTGAYPRPTVTEAISPRGLPIMFLDHRQVFLFRATRDLYIPDEQAFARTVPQAVALPVNVRLAELGLKEVWHEYGCYVTWLGLALAALGAFAGARTHWPLYVAGLIALLTVLGDGSPINTWAALQKLPLYGSMHMSSRFLAAVVFVLASAAAFGYGWLERHLPRRRAPGLVRYAIPLVIYGELAVMGWSLFGDIFICDPAIPRTVAQRTARDGEFATRVERSTFYYPTMTSCLYPFLMANTGVLHGYENLAVEQGDVKAARDPDYRGEAWLDGAEGSATISYWTMSRVHIALDVRTPGTLVLNQNFFEGWRATILSDKGVRSGGEATSHSGLVAASARPGDIAVEFDYVPPGFTVGAWVSGLALIVCVALLVVRRRSPAEPTS